MGPLVRLLGSGIGLTREAMAARKERKSQKSAELPPQPSEDPPELVHVTHDECDELVENGHAVPVGYKEDDDPSTEHVAGDIVDDEEDWQLDDAIEDDNSDDAEKPDVRKITQTFLVAHSLPADSKLEALPCPVIIPQRRPRTKSRGFVRAYAPILSTAGIDQGTWMDFLETFHKASQASPIFIGIVVAGNLIGFVPSVSAMIASTVLVTVGQTAVVLHSRSRTNTFLDNVNEYFFRPRGLYVLLIEYKESRHRWSSEALDISHTVAKNSAPADAPKEGNRGAKLKHKLAFSAGKSHGEMEMPEAAPLIYPSLDKAALEKASSHTSTTSSSTTLSPTTSATKKEEKSSKIPGMNKFKENSAFVDSYLDRRAQAVFTKENPNSQLNLPEDQKPKFASRYSDPNHPASSGSLVSLLTGGHVDPRGRRRARDQKMKEKLGFMGPLGYVRHYQPIRRTLRQGVLYLMVVNWPGDEAIAKAKAELEKQVKVEEGENGESVVAIDDEEDVKRFEKVGLNA